MNNERSLAKEITEGFEALKSMRNNDMNLRDEFAIQIMAGICAGDWKFAIENPSDWDKHAVKRAYEIADAMLKEREIDNV
jgi:hypothetical protein